MSSDGRAVLGDDRHEGRGRGPRLATSARWPRRASPRRRGTTRRRRSKSPLSSADDALLGRGAARRRGRGATAPPRSRSRPSRRPATTTSADADRTSACRAPRRLAERMPVTNDQRDRRRRLIERRSRRGTRSSSARASTLNVRPSDGGEHLRAGRGALAPAHSAAARASARQHHQQRVDGDGQRGAGARRRRPTTGRARRRATIDRDADADEARRRRPGGRSAAPGTRRRAIAAPASDRRRAATEAGSGPTVAVAGRARASPTIRPRRLSGGAAWPPTSRPAPATTAPPATLSSVVPLSDPVAASSTAAGPPRSGESPTTPPAATVVGGRVTGRVVAGRHRPAGEGRAPRRHCAADCTCLHRFIRSFRPVDPPNVRR